jgi:hypothetical protein
MMVMPANNTGMTVGYLAGRWPGRIGSIMSPDGWRTLPPWLPYAIDNGAYPIWRRGGTWDEDAFYRLCAKATFIHEPLWIAVPDVVADREATLDSWRRHHLKVSLFAPHLAFVVQDEMTPDDIPNNADVVFIGGTTEWKWKNLRTWTKHFPRVHVGRVNTERLLWEAHDAGAESCDGTGWFRGDVKQLNGLFHYLEHSSNGQ